MLLLMSAWVCKQVASSKLQPGRKAKGKSHAHCWAPSRQLKGKLDISIT